MRAVEVEVRVVRVVDVAELLALELERAYQGRPMPEGALLALEDYRAALGDPAGRLGLISTRPR